VKLRTKVWEELTVCKQDTSVCDMETELGQKLGPTGHRVAANVKRLRGRVPVRELSDRLTRLGRPILPSGITKIEQGSRRVDADDLVALAMALGVNVSALLLPDVSDEEPVTLMPDMAYPAWAVWQWADGLNPLPTRPSDDEQAYNTDDEIEEFQKRARPASMRREAAHPLVRAVTYLRHRAGRVLHHAGKSGDDPTLQQMVDVARRAVERVTVELDVIETKAEDS
jgi:transcriptional regulator with XRE-family HTH domain